MYAIVVPGDDLPIVPGGGGARRGALAVARTRFTRKACKDAAPRVRDRGAGALRRVWRLPTGDVPALTPAPVAATRFLLPPQALEFMAAGLPVVSTALPDVQALYFPAVAIASAERFADACQALLGEGAPERRARLAEMQRLVAAHSVDELATTVQRLLAETCKRAPARRGGGPRRDAATGRLAAPA